MGLIRFDLPNGSSVSMIEENDRTAVHERNGGFERESLALWCSWIKPGRNYIDIGAYTGLYSMIACRLGGRVLAVEPYPPAMKRLLQNADINGASPLVLEGAASDRDGKANLHFNMAIALTSGSTIENGQTPHRPASIFVPTFKIDAIASTTIVDAMKIDVEGHERCVIIGALQTIERCRPKLIVETLTEETRRNVMLELPGCYRLSAVLDNRNSVFESA